MKHTVEQDPVPPRVRAGINVSNTRNAPPTTNPDTEQHSPRNLVDGSRQRCHFTSIRRVSLRSRSQLCCGHSPLPKHRWINHPQHPMYSYPSWPCVRCYILQTVREIRNPWRCSCCRRSETSDSLPRHTCGARSQVSCVGGKYWSTKLASFDRSPPSRRSAFSDNGTHARRRQSSMSPVP